MPSLLDPLFSKLVELKQFREISANIKTEKFDIFIREAQTVEIAGFLGLPLYSAMVADWDPVLEQFNDERFNELWFGIDYVNNAGVDIRFRGYQPSALYYAYSRFLKQQQTNVSRFGVQSIQDTVSVDQSAGTVRTKANDAEQMAKTYELQTATFLYEKRTTYPEFYQNNSGPSNNTAFDFFVLR